MPRIVDDAERRDEIGRVALEIAFADGVSAVTFRAVAAGLGATSTTAVTHYASSRVEVLKLMLSSFYSAVQTALEPGDGSEEPRAALAALIESVLPTDPFTLLGARIAFDASLQIGSDLGSQDELERWGEWLYTRVESLVEQIHGPSSIAVSDAVVATVTGVSLSTLIDGDYWTPERQRAAVVATLDAHDLSCTIEVDSGA